MIDPNNCSVVEFYKGSAFSMTDVMSRIKLANLPIESVYSDNVWSFIYSHGKCDGNTAHHLRKILDGLIGLYKRD